MSGDVLISVSPGEVRAALAENGRAVELRIERAGTESRVGEIHLGRVLRLLPALPGAHIDIGTGRPAFLSEEDALDIAPPEHRGGGIAAWLHEGQAIIVQVTRDAQGEKAINVTARPRLGGRLLALTPTRKKIVVPRGSAKEARLPMEALLGEILPAGCGAIVEPAAFTAGRDALVAESAALRGRWATFQERARDATPPALIASEDDPLGRLLAAAAAWQPARILIDSRAAFAAARAWLARHHPDLAARLALDIGDEDIFERHGIGGDVAGVTDPRVSLADGGALLIAAAPAMTVIDVDGGGAVKRRGDVATAALGVNIAAAAEAARQIRLRNLAGAIVVDFISMRRHADRARVLTAFAAALSRDPGSPHVLGWTRLGHVELTRRRRHRPLAEILCESPAAGGCAKSALTVALAALRGLACEAARRPARAPSLGVHPEVAAALAGPAAAARRELEAELACPVAVRADPLLPREAFDIRLD